MTAPDLILYNGRLATLDRANPNATALAIADGTIVAVGPGSLNDEGQRTAVEVKVGDKVIYGKYAGSNIKIEGEEYVLLREAELLAKVEG